MILAALIQADLLSIMYPLALFTWGSVARPRPNFYFWWFIITYTEVIVWLLDHPNLVLPDCYFLEVPLRIWLCV